MSCCASCATAIIVAGADWLCPIELTPCERGWSLDGWRVEAQLRAHLDAPPSLTLSTDDGSLIVVDPRGLRLTTSVAASATAALRPGDYMLDLRLTNTVTGIVMQTGCVAVSVVTPVTRG